MTGMFNGVNRNKLWNIFKHKGYPLHIISIIQTLSQNTHAHIDIHDIICIDLGNERLEIITLVVTNQATGKGCSQSSQCIYSVSYTHLDVYKRQ